MTDDRMMRAYSGHSHDPGRYPTPVIELDGAPVSVSVDIDAVLWTCDLRGGECVSRPLDLDAAGPDDAWYLENDYWDEDDDEYGRRKIVIRADNIASRMTVSQLDGRPVVVTGGDRYDFSFEDDYDSSGGIVRVWDLRTGKRVGTVMIGHDLGVCSLTTVPSERGPLVVSSCEQGKLLAWEMATGEPAAELEAGYNGEMGAALVDGRPIAVTGGDDDFLQVWDIRGGEQIGEDLTGIEPCARAIAIAEPAGRAVVVAGGDDARLHLWDLATQEPIGSPMTGHTDGIERMGIATVAGRTVAVTGSPSDIRVWDLARGEQVGDPLTGHHLQTVTEIAGTPVAVVRGPGGALRLWDLTLAGR
ncbi:hypothetical protein [Actinoallomurus sp. NPDC050550]|uniref:WD40 repeat domain-containing protein n=1 Tax=Actinoallomurus sp. NPDC050550 TaxID=3154937 RepID=UPI00340CD42F